MAVEEARHSNRIERRRSSRVRIAASPFVGSEEYGASTDAAALLVVGVVVVGAHRMQRRCVQRAAGSFTVRQCGQCPIGSSDGSRPQRFVLQACNPFTNSFFHENTQLR